MKLGSWLAAAVSLKSSELACPEPLSAKQGDCTCPISSDKSICEPFKRHSIAANTLHFHLVAREVGSSHSEPPNQFASSGSQWQSSTAHCYDSSKSGAFRGQCHCRCAINDLTDPRKPFQSSKIGCKSSFSASCFQQRPGMQLEILYSHF